MFHSLSVYRQSKINGMECLHGCICHNNKEWYILVLWLQTKLPFLLLTKRSSHICKSRSLLPSKWMSSTRQERVVFSQRSGTDVMNTNELEASTKLFDVTQELSVFCHSLANCQMLTIIIRSIQFDNNHSAHLIVTMNTIV